MSTIATNKGDWVGTKAQYVALNSIDTNKRYYITDLETFVITNSAMASALTTYSSLYNVGDVFLCIDSGTYSQNTFYKFNSSSWVEVGQLVSSSEKTTWNNKSNFSGSYNDLTNKPTLGTAAALNTGTSQGNIPLLGSNGKLPSTIIPASAITDTFVVSSENAMLALSTAEVGDVAVRTDLNKSFILKTDGASTLANWQELLTPTDSVTSVNGMTGAVTGLQTELSASNKLNADYISDGTTNKAYTATEKSKLSGIESGAEVNDVTDFQVNGTSVVSSKVANIVTNTAYNASTNKIATIADVPVFSATDVTITEVN